MIKKLIENLANESITLTSGLNQTKIIAKKIKNDNLTNWLQYELKGYPEGNKEVLPEYRNFTIQLIGDVIDNYGTKSEQVILNTLKLGDQLGVDMNNHSEQHDIESIEHAVLTAEGEFVENPFDLRFVEMLDGAMNKSNPNHRLIYAAKKIALGNLRKILTQTRQRLLDTLLDLEVEFPELDKQFKPTEENKEKAQNIINYNVYGGKLNTNLGIGKKVVQSDISFNSNQLEEIEGKLKELGVPLEDANEAIEIIKSTDKESLGKKLMAWAGDLTTKAIEKGIELKVPLLMQTISEII